MASMDSANQNKMVCERCFKQNKLDVYAAGYCSTCAKYFCSSCLHVHRNLLPSHKLEKMPEHFTMKRCKVHDSEFLKFYCEQHDSFICNLCTRKDEHFSCRSLETISSLTMKMKSNEEYQTFQDDLGEVLKRATHLKREYEKEIDFLDRKNKYCVKKADSYAAHRALEVSEDFLIVDNFDHVLTVKEELKNISEIERTAQQTLSEIINLPYELKEQACDMYMTLKAASTTIKHCSGKLNIVPEPPPIKAYRKKYEPLLSEKEVFVRYVNDIFRLTRIMLQYKELGVLVTFVVVVIVLLFMISTAILWKIATSYC